jgi:gas vesicle protein
MDQSEQKRNNLYYALIGFGAGAIVGATLALLYAPQSGRETRDAIKEKLGETTERAGEYYSSAKDAVGSAYERTASAIGRASERLRRSHGDEQEEA